MVRETDEPGAIPFANRAAVHLTIPTAEKFRANAKRATMVQSRIKTVEKMDAEAPEPVVVDPVWRFSIPSSEPLSRPIISIDDVSFDYTPTSDDGSKKSESEFLLQQVNFGVDLSSRIAILGANGQGTCGSAYRNGCSDEILTHMTSHLPPRQDNFTEPSNG